MIVYLMTEAENQLAQIIWEQEPVGSGQLVKLASERLNWKKSTTYTVLRKICGNGIFKKFVDDTFSGSLPGFVAAFLKKKKLSRQEIEELAQMIEAYRED